nr:histidine phosphotransferase family protein [Wolbachia endosymbiont of Ctenocephalides felis wCfeT]
MGEYYAVEDESLVEKINKVVSSMVLTIASAVAGVEQVSILLSKEGSKTLLTIRISNENKPLSGSLTDKLSNKSDTNLNTKDINVYMTSLLLKSYNAEVSYICNNNLIEVQIRLT